MATGDGSEEPIGYLSGRRIVVADDDDTLRFCLSEILEEDGAEVLAVSDGRRLVDLLATTSADAVVTDMRMPSIGGLDALRRRRDAGDTTPFVLVTGAVVDLDLSALAPAVVIEKPFSQESLQAALEGVMAPQPRRAARSR
jgi:CheY-like chemotaxis protein